MSGNTRVMKEARPLLVPSAVVLAAGLAAFAPVGSSELVSQIGYWNYWFTTLGLAIGIPLIASIPIGDEFQHGTIPLLLSQPVTRARVWSVKLRATMIALLPLVALYGLVFRVSIEPEHLRFVLAWMIAVASSSVLWTLVAQSTIGGALLNAGVQWCVCYFASETAGFVLKRHPLWTGPMNGVAAAGLVAYALTMIVLGRRHFANFQLSGRAEADDLLSNAGSGVRWLPSAWFHSQPTGAMLNLVRKEIRLLRPVWLLTLLVPPAWAIVSLRVFNHKGDWPSDSMAAGIVSVLSLVIAVLAGCLSVGEERQAGTHAWHLTQPISNARQWAVKLLAALLTSCCCAVIVPTLVLMAAGAPFGTPFLFLRLNPFLVCLLGAALVTFTAFWCACITNRTVSAVLLMFPVVGTAVAISVAGSRLGEVVVQQIASRFDVFGSFRRAYLVLRAGEATYTSAEHVVLAITLPFAPVLMVALVQTYRTFGDEGRRPVQAVLRRCATLALAVFAVSVAISGAQTLFFHSARITWVFLARTQVAVQQSHATEGLQPGHTLTLSGDDLVRTGNFSDRSRKWLHNASVTVTPEQFKAGLHSCDFGSGSVRQSGGVGFQWLCISIHFPDGMRCDVSFQPARDNYYFGKCD